MNDPLIAIKNELECKLCENKKRVSLSLESAEALLTRLYTLEKIVAQKEVKSDAEEDFRQLFTALIQCVLSKFGFLHYGYTLKKVVQEPKSYWLFSVYSVSTKEDLITLVVESTEDKIEDYHKIFDALVNNALTTISSLKFIEQDHTIREA